MAVESNLHKLQGLAGEESSERRRALLREVTDLFFDAPPKARSKAQAQFDNLLTTLAAQTSEAARVELAARFSDAVDAPQGLILQLARDAIAVAGPILQRSEALSEDDLVAIVHETTQDHMRAITKRAEVSERVSHAIVEKGDDETVASLVRNDGARFSRATYEEVARRAEESRALQGPLVHRADTPPDLLNDLMMVVETALREQITQRFEKLEPGVLEAALAASQQRMQARIREDAALTEARAKVRRAMLKKELDGGYLAARLREKDHVTFAVAFSEMTGVEYAAAKKAVEHESVDGLALICKAAGLDKALFVTICVLRAGAEENAFRNADAYGELYAKLDKAAAERAVRFQRLRRSAAA